MPDEPKPDEPMTGVTPDSMLIADGSPRAVAAVFARLEGTWALRREISGEGGSRSGEMLGRAIFSPLRPGVLHYREDGRLELASGYAGDACREYYYLLEPDHIHVTFADAPPGERTFLRLRPRPTVGGAGHRADDIHYCGRDVYTGAYDFASAGRLVLTMAVRGPEKDYVIRTVLTRMPTVLGRLPHG
jgi:hypothetical protein